MSTEDRRIRKTKQALRVALDDLLLEHRYDRISVQDIIDRADVGKTTFYAHYGGKDDLLAGNCFTTQIAAAFDDDAGGPREVPDFERLLEHFSTRHEVGRTMFGGPGWDVVRAAAQRDLYEGWLRWAHQQSNLRIPAEPTAHFLTAGVLALVEKWPDVTSQLLTAITRSVLIEQAPTPNSPD